MLVAHENVVGLDVAVRDAERVHVRERGGQLAADSLSLLQPRRLVRCACQEVAQIAIKLW